jgi:hypothetical protein
MCPNVTKEQLHQRLREKHAECLPLWEFENGFEMSPEQSALVFETARGTVNRRPPNRLMGTRGQHSA